MSCADDLVQVWAEEDRCNVLPVLPYKAQLIQAALNTAPGRCDDASAALEELPRLIRVVRQGWCSVIQEGVKQRLRPEIGRLRREGLPHQTPRRSALP